MTISMTGFGRGRASSNGIALNVECKSVNSRYLDISLRLPKMLQEKELKLKELVQSRVGRGNLNLQVTIEKTETEQPRHAINKELVKGYKQLLEELRDTANVKAPVTLQDLIKFDDIFVSRPQDEKTINAIWQLTLQATEDALEQLAIMRRQEGKQLQQDLYKRLDQIDKSLKKIQTIGEDRPEQLQQQLLKRIHNLLEGETLDEGRLEMEVAILADKMDITEEVVRLRSHIKFFKEALETDNAVGRRLKFLCQEMNREINTMGAKSNHSEISQLVVQAKESLEQIREQVLNVE